jgi:predicted nuclease with TOPRIM domain
MKLLLFFAVSLPSLSWTKSEPTKDDIRRLIEDYMTDHNVNIGCASLREDIDFLTSENLILKQTLSKMEAELTDLKSRVDDVMTENEAIKERMVVMDKEMSHAGDAGHVTGKMNHGYQNNSDREDFSQNHQQRHGSSEYQF